jgi:hypothetical protein
MADKGKGIAGLILAMKAKPEAEGPEVESGEEAGGDEMGLDAAGQELIDAVDAKDAAGVAMALRNAFAILESEPHVEGEHTDE